MDNLAEARKALYNAPRGAAVLRSCGVDTYLRSPAEWRLAAASAAAARDQFAQLFGGAQPQRGDEDGSAAKGRQATAHDGPVGGNKSSKQEQHAASRTRIADTAVDDAAPDPKKKRKKAKTESSAATAPLGGQQTEAMLELLGTSERPSLCRCIVWPQELPESIYPSVQVLGKLAAATRQSQVSERRRKGRARTAKNLVLRRKQRQNQHSRQNQTARSPRSGKLWGPMRLKL